MSDIVILLSSIAGIFVLCRFSMRHKGAEESGVC